ncbi:MAG: diversity-generating retroelement protein Avd [Patescibacteria group bacterium]|nr:diversity-generating retroelement protein Avd [Patescibacteria group bacterium]
MENFHSPSIIQKVYDFYAELYLVVEKMPKKDKYALGEKLQKITLDFLELLITASNKSKDKKYPFMELASTKLEVLKITIRLSHEVKAIPTSKYHSLEERLQEIGRMLGGWINSIKTP